MANETRVLFATDVDPIELICDILVGTKEVRGAIFGVMSDCSGGGCESEDFTGTVKLCLPARRPRGGDRLRCVFVLKMSMTRLMTFLLSKPLTAEDISKYICRRKTESIFNPIVDTLLKVKDRNKGAGFRQKVLWVRAKFLSCLRKLYKVSPSPQWMISTFGSIESQFVFTAAYYFFVGDVSTVETIGHLARLFETETGRLLTDVITYQDLGLVYVNSKYTPRISEFFDYVAKKLKRDDMEAKAIRECIDDSRTMFMLSDKETIQYIYLAYHECFNAKQFMHYSAMTAPSGLADCEPEPILVKHITDEFRGKMASYYNKDTYLRTYVQKEEICMSIDNQGYDAHLFEHTRGQYWIGTSTDVGNALTMIEKEFPELRTSKDLSALLDLAGQTRSETDDPLAFLLDVESICSRLPVYRCEFMNRHYFVLPVRDGLAAAFKEMVLLPELKSWTERSDTDLTLAIGYRESYCSARELREQVYISRHEFFNNRLPVYHLVLDFDLKLTGTSLSLQDIYLMVCEIRREILDLLSYIGPVQEDHPVYFFKSACPSIDLYDELQSPVRSFCTCTDKLGMRIITPFPKGYVVVGEETIVALVGVLNRVVMMNRVIVGLCGDCFRDGVGPFDVGIYHKGRSIRLPYTYKVGTLGRLERLLKLFVCHPGDREAYVHDTLNPSNLLHHSKHTGWPDAGHIIYDMRDINEGFLSKRTMERLPRGSDDVLDRVTVGTGLSAIQWIEDVAWPSIVRTLLVSFPEDKAIQFNSVSFEVVTQSLVNIKARGLPFKCLRFNHRNRKTSVRAFLILRHVPGDKTCITFMTQCFADKCNSNTPMAHFSVRLSTPCLGSGM
ncbi:DNA helicase-primase subunit B [Vombatid gammaherpesvirus 1]|uniref:DNA helicase-primase subunit B n=1 Tax=Vombatid gammaherpesvirus 1 TaxID=2052651 RepID=A0A3Q8J755_9GAMA|nr:DNA helicase-primase subunit B [Vombatid gammaherpesvirus 1]AZB49154.1 DNA helicase-primase subunit B [Vombatid gammaherpesvirus 1]